ncbi:MAG: CbiQ family ECF transporter T component, partial [Syntrophomonas sp.]
MSEYSAGQKNTDVEIDAGIKAALAIILAIAASFCNSGWDLVYFTVYLLIITVLLKSNLRFILKNLLSYGIIILFPYSFGILLSFLMNRLFSGSVYVNNVNLEAALFKMIKIFFIWYIGNLYFFTTPFEKIADMLNKVFSPLNSVGIPVARYLNMTMFIVNELVKSVGRFKQDIFEQARHIFKNNEIGIKTKAKELSNILVSFIANSLQGTDEMQDRFERSRENNCSYKLRVSKNEIA